MPEPVVLRWTRKQFLALLALDCCLLLGYSCCWFAPFAHQPTGLLVIENRTDRVLRVTPLWGSEGDLSVFEVNLGDLRFPSLRNADIPVASRSTRSLSYCCESGGHPSHLLV